MKKIYYQILLGVIAFFSLQSCNNHKTYGELVDEENEAIERYLLENDIKVISKQEFLNNDSTTKENEYVYFEENGIYMNVIYKGAGQNILPEGSYDMLSRFIEIAIKDVKDMGVEAGDTLVRNMYANEYPSLQLKPEEYKVTIKDKAFTGQFNGYSLMYKTYEQDTAVPTGWMFPLLYLKPIRTNEAAKWARVKLIVPHTEGTRFAARFVYPCYYEITYNLGK